MSSAAIEKLKSLLKRVEERRGRPRLHAVAAPAPHAVAAPAPHAAPPSGQTLLSGQTLHGFAAPDLRAPIAPAPPPVSVRPAAKKSPIEDAIGDFDSPALEVKALAEPITTPRSEQRAPAKPTVPESDVAVTYRPEPPARAPAPAPIAQVVPLQPVSSAKPAPSEPPFFVEPEAAPTADTVPPAAIEAPAAPTHVIAPAPLAGSPVHATSAPRIEAPKSFGELLELSLALRPR
jgi:hypothetical protein